MPRRSTPLDAAGCTRSRQPARRDVRSRRVRGQVRVLVVMFFSRGQQPEENTTLLASLLRTSSTSHSHLMILFFILVKKKKIEATGRERFRSLRTESALCPAFLPVTRGELYLLLAEASPHLGSGSHVLLLLWNVTLERYFSLACVILSNCPSLVPLDHV